ncbi:SDR family oxidoreductase [Candidatus Chloroploca mongolica]|uniref:SDR family oxidoreductase n=1 Tax=Candidatus Chloroploca mongolica TaxID=2528176 RepID=UPI001C20DDCF|nr:sugar nucleotide-binding protein [Candidatus Chloroploca mongolica]
MTRGLITGGTGYLGQVLIRQACALGYDVVATHYTQIPVPVPGVTWAALDVRDPHAVRSLVEAVHPAWVIHTAFLQNGPEVMAITGEGAGHVAVAAAAVNARLIHLSSDVIFDGERDTPYTEDDPPEPVTDYGRAKAHAEALVAAAHPKAVLVRTSLIYGFDPIDKISRFVLDVAEGRAAAALFTDEYRCPIFVEDLAAALLELLTLPYQGVLHIAGASCVSRYAMGCLIAQAWQIDPTGIPAGLSATSPIRRPRNCRLAITRAQALLQTRLRGIDEVLRERGGERRERV